VRKVRREPLSSPRNDGEKKRCLMNVSIQPIPRGLVGWEFRSFSLTGDARAAESRSLVGENRKEGAGNGSWGSLQLPCTSSYPHRRLFGAAPARGSCRRTSRPLLLQRKEKLRPAFGGPITVLRLRRVNAIVIVVYIYIRRGCGNHHVNVRNIAFLIIVTFRSRDPRDLSSCRRTNGW
jgi:hypothetical protein